MVGPILKESIIFIVFCHIFVSGKDILEVFRPNPSLPQELNEWLATVQNYKNDFRFIREIAAASKDNRDSDIPFEDDGDDSFEEEAFDKLNLENASDLEDQPKNDIYPYMYEGKPVNPLNSNKFSSRDDNEEYNSNNLNSALRLRRDLNFFDSQNPVNVQSKGKNGEIRRSDSKYPERYVNKDEFSEENVNLKNNFKEVKDHSKVDDSVKKREIQIDVRNNGKLIKQITETGKNPRPILLNIQAQAKESPINIQDHIEKITRNLLPNLNPILQNAFNNAQSNNIPSNNIPTSNIQNNNFPNNNLLNNNVIPNNNIQNPIPSNNFQNNIIPNSNIRNNLVQNNNGREKEKHAHPNFEVLPDKRDFSQVRSVKTEHKEMEKKESLNDFNNLFAVNEHLNTDSSLARDGTKDLIYRITYTYNTPAMHNLKHGYNTDNKKYIFNINSNSSNFNHNNLQDMSDFWTDSEKNRMRQGIEIARNNEYFKKFPQQILSSTKVHQIRENDTGFEPAQRIELDRENIVEINARNKKQMIEMNTNDNIPNFEDPPEQNRPMGLIENKCQLGSRENYNSNNYDANERNLDEDVAEYTSSMVNSDRTPIDNIVVINPPLDEDKFMEENLDSISPEYNDVAEDSLNVRQDNPEVALKDSIDDIAPAMDHSKLACGLASVGLSPNLSPDISQDLPQPDPMDTVNMEESPNVGDMDCGVGADPLDQNFRIHTVHKYITKTESITEVIEYPNDEEADKNHYRQAEQEPCCSLDDQPHEHRGSNLVVASSNRKSGNHGRTHKSPAPDKIVFIRNRPRYGLTNARKYGDSKVPRLAYRDNEKKVVDYRGEEKDPYGFNHLEQKTSNKRPNYRSLFASVPSANLMVNRPPNYNERRLKKYYSGNSRGSINSRLNRFGTLLSSNHGKYLNMGTDDTYYNEPKSVSDFIPAFIGRKLNAVEYAYDAYLDAPGEDAFDEASTELQEIELARVKHKNSVEGDYGDEEDSITERAKNKGYSIFKKTQNEFANPRTTTETDYDDDYVEDYDDKGNNNEHSVITSTKEDNKKQQAPHVNDHLPVIQRNSEENTEKNRGMSELKVNDLNSFAHHLHKKFNTLKKNKRIRSSLRKEHKVRSKKEKGSNNARRNANKRNTSKKRHKRNRVSNARFIDTNSDFQHWPSFVINDNENEENLNKRSLVMQKKHPRINNNFPLASKDFFVKQQEQQKVVNAKDAKPAYNSAHKRDDNSPLNIEKRLPEETEITSVVTDIYNLSDNVTCADANKEKDDKDKCDVCQTNLTNVCEQSEDFNRTKTEMTTILAIISESFSESCDPSDNRTHRPQSFEKLDDIISGELPSRLVDDVFAKVGIDTKLKHRFHKGLTKTNKDTSFINVNETNTETKKLILAMENIINKLEFTTTCQRLPYYLMVYLRTITKVKRDNVLEKLKEMDDIEFDVSQNEENFIFESVNHGGGDTLEQKVKILKDLLTKFNNLPDKCKSRAKPVKEYIENHLGLLSNLEYGGGVGVKKDKGALGKPSLNKPIINAKRTVEVPWKDEDILVQEQLASLGLGNRHNFKPKFSLDELIQNRKYAKVTTVNGKQATPRPQNVNVNKRDLQSVSTSKQYNKLVDAVRKVRLRREGARRLGEMYGKSKRESDDYSEFHEAAKNSDPRYISRANFESPLVYSL